MASPISTISVGKEVGALKVTSLAKIQNKRRYWNCRCQCGNDIVVRANQLTGNKPIQSCGCLKKTADFNGNKPALTLDQYLEIAKRITMSYKGSSFRDYIINNEDAIAFVTHQIIVADIKWNGVGTLEGFRAYKGHKSVLSYKAKCRAARSRQKQTISIDNLKEDFRNDSTHPITKEPDILTSLTNHNKLDEPSDDMLEMWDQANLTEKERKVLVLKYYKANTSSTSGGFTSAMIGQRIKATPDEVRALLQSALNKLRQLYKVAA